MSRKLLLLAAVALLAACEAPATYNQANDYAQRERLLDQRCGQAADVGACRDRTVREAQAAIYECQMQGQMAAASAANPRYLVDIYSAATGNQVFETCMRMKAAQLGY